MATIEKRTNKDGKSTYRVKVRLKGYPTQTATFERLTDAKKWTQSIESAIREGRYFKINESKKHTLSDLIERYLREVAIQRKNLNDVRTQLSWWNKNIGSYLLSDITVTLITEYRSKLQSEKSERREGSRSSSTVNRYCSSLSHCFSIAVKEFG